MNNIETKCVELFSKIMGVPLESIGDHSSPDSIEEWDSLLHVELISNLEKTFSIQISPEEGIELEDFKSIVSIVENKLH
ncbi:MAG: acyl carrier protein [Desulfobacterales bacterium]|jgi:acyl carrier protein